MRFSCIALVVFLHLLLVLPTFAQVPDSIAYHVSTLSAWDIEFHAILPNGQYIQERRNPSRKDIGAIAVFNNGHLAGQYYKIEKNCYTGTPAFFSGNPAILIHATECSVYTRLDDMLWLLRSKLEVVRLESIGQKQQGGTEY